MKTGTRKINFLLEPCKRAYLRREATREANNRIIALNSYERGYMSLENKCKELLDARDNLLNTLMPLFAGNNDWVEYSRCEEQLAKVELDLQELERWA